MVAFRCIKSNRVLRLRELEIKNCRTPQRVDTNTYPIPCIIVSLSIIFRNCFSWFPLSQAQEVELTI